MPFISPAQVRAARAMLDWTIVDLAEKARISISTVKRFEDGQGAPASVGMMQDALETEGIRFVEDKGGVGILLSRVQRYSTKRKNNAAL